MKRALYPGKHLARNLKAPPLNIISDIERVRGDYILRVQVHSYNNPTNSCPTCTDSDNLTVDKLTGVIMSFLLLEAIESP